MRENKNILKDYAAQNISTQDSAFRPAQQILSDDMLIFLSLPANLVNLIKNYLENDVIILKYLEILTHISQRISDIFPSLSNKPDFLREVVARELQIQSTVLSTLVDMTISFRREIAILQDPTGTAQLLAFFREPVTFLNANTPYNWRQVKNHYYTAINDFKLEDFKRKLFIFSEIFTREYSYVNINLKVTHGLEDVNPRPESLELKFPPSVAGFFIKSDYEELSGNHSPVFMKWMKKFKNCNYNPVILKNCFSKMSRFFYFFNNDDDTALVSLLPFFTGLQHLVLVNPSSPSHFAIKKLIEILPGCIFLQTMDFEEYEFNDENTVLLIRVLPHLFVNALKINGGAIDRKYFSNFFQALSQNENITDIGRLFNDMGGSPEMDWPLRRLQQNYIGASYTCSTSLQHTRCRYANYLENILIALPFVLLSLITEYLSEDFSEDKSLYFSVMLQALEKITGCSWELGESSNRFSIVVNSQEDQKDLIEKLQKNLPNSGPLNHSSRSAKVRVTLGRFTVENYKLFISYLKMTSDYKEYIRPPDFKTIPAALELFTKVVPKDEYKWIPYQLGCYYCDMPSRQLPFIMDTIGSTITAHPELGLQLVVNDQILDIKFSVEQGQKLLSLVSRDEASTYLGKQKFNFFSLQAESSGLEKNSEETLTPLIEVTREHLQMS